MLKSCEWFAAPKVLGARFFLNESPLAVHQCSLVDQSQWHDVKYEVARWQHRTAARSTLFAKWSMSPSWEDRLFFSWNKPIGGRGGRSIAISAVLALTIMNTGASMIEWCENGIVSVVSPGNHGGSYAELARAGRIVGALS